MKFSVNLFCLTSVAFTLSTAAIQQAGADTRYGSFEQLKAGMTQAVVADYPGDTLRISRLVVQNVAKDGTLKGSTTAFIEGAAFRLLPGTVDGHGDAEFDIFHFTLTYSAARGEIVRQVERNHGTLAIHSINTPSSGEMSPDEILHGPVQSISGMTARFRSGWIFLNSYEQVYLFKTSGQLTWEMKFNQIIIPNLYSIPEAFYYVQDPTGVVTPGDF